MKKLFYGLIILAVLVGGGFALFEDRIFTDIPEDVISNLEMRYTGKFKFMGYIEEENTENSRAMKIKGEYGEFKLTRYYDDKGVIHYNDNYLGYKYRGRLKEELDTVLSFPLYEGTLAYEVDLDSSTFPDNTDRSILFHKLLEKDEIYIKLKLVSTFKWSDSDIKNLALKLKENLGVKVIVSALECENGLVRLSDFDSVMRSAESSGKRVFFSIGKNKEILFTNRE